MIIPSCRCHHDDRPNSHHPSCLAIAEPQPLSPAQLSALSVVATRDILSRKTPTAHRSSRTCWLTCPSTDGSDTPTDCSPATCAAPFLHHPASLPALPTPPSPSHKNPTTPTDKSNSPAGKTWPASSPKDSRTPAPSATKTYAAIPRLLTAVRPTAPASRH